MIPVPAPGFALVFFDNTDEALKLGQATQTFSTSAWTQAHNTATYEPSAIPSSNGRSELSRGQIGGTSPGGENAAISARSGIMFSVLQAMGALVLGGLWIRRVYL